MKITARDAVKIPAKEWDKLPQRQRDPYVEVERKGGFVYAVRETEKSGEKRVLNAHGE
jgi:hypothetical protein